MRSASARCWSRPSALASRSTTSARTARWTASYVAGSRQRRSASIASRARSCGKTPSGPDSTKDSPRSHSSSSAPSGSPRILRSRPPVVARAWATISSARRWRGLGTPARNPLTSAETTSGTASSAAGASPWERTSSSSESASGWPCVIAASRAPGGGGDAGPGEHLARLVRCEVAQRQHPQQVAPARVPAPVLAGAPAAGDDHERPRRQPRNERLAQPSLERGGGLEGVEQEHRPLPAGQLAAGRALELGEERGRGGLDGAQVEPDRRAAALLRRLRECRQQRGLADAAGRVHPEHAERRLRGVDRAEEELELGRAADEPGAPRSAEPVRHGAACDRVGHRARARA